MERGGGVAFGGERVGERVRQHLVQLLFPHRQILSVLAVFHRACLFYGVWRCLRTYVGVGAFGGREVVT